ncbi:hypothetical protein E2C01_068048 [Portunus trituberculatus]|uniref:Uncharacterized protein n=1 Tax=Portunus trituberculatus TaxID=210409 RepID=A0A5B7HLF3_PORTR|nr:hypothetical protein [Portunus trituberculatus]
MVPEQLGETYMKASAPARHTPSSLGESNTSNLRVVFPESSIINHSPGTGQRRLPLHNSTVACEVPFELHESDNQHGYSLFIPPFCLRRRNRYPTDDQVEAANFSPTMLRRDSAPPLPAVAQ